MDIKREAHRTMKPLVFFLMAFFHLLEALGNIHTKYKIKFSVLSHAVTFCFRESRRKLAIFFCAGCF